MRIIPITMFSQQWVHGNSRKSLSVYHQDNRIDCINIYTATVYVLFMYELTIITLLQLQQIQKYLHVRRIDIIRLIIRAKWIVKQLLLSWRKAHKRTHPQKDLWHVLCHGDMVGAGPHCPMEFGVEVSLKTSHFINTILFLSGCP